MAYNNNVPLANQSISSTQTPILNNFIALNSWGNGYGEYVLQASTPSFSANNDGMYTKAYNNTTNTLNELFVHKQAFGATTKEIPFTASILSQATPAAMTSGWTYLPSGILLRWENIASGTGLSTITLSSGYPAFNQILNIILCPYSSSTTDDNFAVRLVAINSTTQFQVYFSSRTSTGSGTGSAKALIIGY